jgi:SAM-dependent methyltransferase
VRWPSAAGRAIPCAGRDSSIERTGLEHRDPATAAALARLYDLDLVDDPGDLDLYLALADRADGPILELAAGTGRLAVPLAEAGHQVTAVDLDRAMLDRARARIAASAAPNLAQRLTLVEADIVGLNLASAGGFSLAFIALNSLLVLPNRAAQRAAFRALAKHLAPGGLAAVDVWIPDADDLARYDGRVTLEWPRLDPETGAIVTKAGSAQHDAASATITVTTTFEEGGQGATPRRWIRRDRLRLVSVDELRGFAEDAGLVVELMAGDYGMGPIGPGSERAILIAVKG